MALPKRRHSKTRSRKRRTHWKLKKPSLARCGSCGEAKMPHRVCPTCGEYKDRPIIEPKE